MERYLKELARQLGAKVGLSPNTVRRCTGFNIRCPVVKQLQSSLTEANKRKTLNILAGRNIIEKIGTKSMNGAVFRLGKSKNPSNEHRLVLKIIKNPKGKQEYNLQQQAAFHGLSPDVYNSQYGIPINASTADFFFTEKAENKGKPVKINAILMNNLKQNNQNQVMSFNSYMSDPALSVVKRRTAFDKLKNMVKTLHTNARISHSDLHAGNIYVITDSNGKIKKLTIIDFGRSNTLRPTRSTANKSLATARTPQTTATRYGQLYYTKNGSPKVTNISKLNNMARNYGIL